MKKYLCCLLALGLLGGCSVENDGNEIVSPPVEQIPEDNKQDLEINSPEKETLSYQIYEETFSFNDESYVPKYKNVQTIYFDSQDLDNLNEKIQSEFENILQENQKNENYDEWRSFYARNIETYEFKDILTVVIRDSIYANHTGGSPINNYTCYHIDKTNHEIMTNTQFLKKIDYDLVDIQNKVDSLIKDFSTIQEETDLTSLQHIYGTKINDDSCIFMSNENLNMVVTTRIIGIGDTNKIIEIK